MCRGERAVRVPAHAHERGRTNRTLESRCAFPATRASLRQQQVSIHCLVKVTSKLKGAVACTPCSKGTFANETGMSECYSCVKVLGYIQLLLNCAFPRARFSLTRDSRGADYAPQARFLQFLVRLVPDHG